MVRPGRQQGGVQLVVAGLGELALPEVVCNTRRPGQSRVSARARSGTEAARRAGRRRPAIARDKALCALPAPRHEPGANAPRAVRLLR